MRNLEKVNDAIQNKIILCTGPSPQDKELLIDTYRNDRKIFAFKRIFLSSVNPANRDIFFKERQSPVILLPDQGKQINCLNSIISTIQAAVNDPNSEDTDIILFKHETYFAKNLPLIQKAIGALVINGYDLVAQIALSYLQDTFCSGNFFIKVSAARPIFKGLTPLVLPPGDKTNCEAYVTSRFFSKVKLVYKVGIRYESKEDHLGFFHLISRITYGEQRSGKQDVQGLFHDVNLEG